MILGGVLPPLFLETPIYHILYLLIFGNDCKLFGAQLLGVMDKKITSFRRIGSGQITKMDPLNRSCWGCLLQFHFQFNHIMRRWKYGSRGESSVSEGNNSIHPGETNSLPLNNGSQQTIQIYTIFTVQVFCLL